MMVLRVGILILTWLGDQGMRLEHKRRTYSESIAQEKAQIE